MASLEEINEIIEQQNSSILEATGKLIDSSAALNKSVNSQLKKYEDRFREMEAEAEELRNRLSLSTVIPQNQSGEVANPLFQPSNILATPGGASGASGASGIPNTQPGAASADTVPSFIKFELSSASAEIAEEDSVAEARDPEEWLAAGSYAPAVITTGADATTSVGGQGDPRPVTMRLIGPAVTASGHAGRARKTDLTGCTITGEARGDLSSERVYVRLLRMTCLKDEGVSEINVRGFVAGGGQAGVRGPVISREGDFTRKTFIAGALSGFGSAASAALTPPAIVSSSGAQAPQQSDIRALEAAGKSGLAAGVGAAGQKLADYYIERAEQYQPVVSLKGGTTVEVVFLEGVWLDGRVSQ